MNAYDKTSPLPMIWLTGQCPSAGHKVAEELDFLLSRRACHTVVLHEAELIGGLCEAASTETEMRENERRLAYSAELFQHAGHAVIVCAGFRPSGWVTMARWILADLLFEVTLVDDGRESGGSRGPKTTDAYPEACFAPPPKLSLVFDRSEIDPTAIACVVATKMGVALESRS